MSESTLRQYRYVRKYARTRARAGPASGPRAKKIMLGLELG